jgi:6-phosphogluconolactonase (cycloisomerase 2 family)
MLVVLSALAVPAAAQAHGRVYTQSNAADGNEVLVYDRGADGALTLAAHVATGGRGAGASLGSQSALAMSDDGRWLFAVNAGSDEVSVLAVGRQGLQLAGRASTGEMPISVAVHGRLVYVLDAGGDGGVSGFRLGDHGALVPIGQAPLANVAPAPAQVAIAPSGDLLVVTEKGTNCIDTLPLDEDGHAGAATCHPSAGQTPFGFAFAPSERDWFGNRYDRLIVSEAFGGAPGAATLSSYLVAGDAVDPLAPAVRTEQTAACWVALARAGRYAYSTNTGSGSVTGFRLHEDGALRLLAPDGRSGDTGTGSMPTDAAVTDGLLDVLDSGTHAISTFRVRGDGILAPVATTTGLPPTAAGLISR